MSRLSVLLSEANVDALSSRELEARSEALGCRLSRDTFWRLLSGRHGAPDEPTLQALHRVFPSLSMRALRRAAALSDEELGPWAPPSEAARLTRRQREILDELVRLLTAPATQQGGDVDAQAPEKRPARLRAVPVTEATSEAEPEPGGPAAKAASTGDGGPRNPVRRRRKAAE